MKILKNFSLLVLIISTAVGCNASIKNRTNSEATTSSNTVQEFSDFTGNYGDENYYFTREGVSVSVLQISNSTIHVSIRTHSDKQCRFDAVAVKTKDNQFQSNIDGKVIVYTFSFNKDYINISTLKDKDFLQYYCSGGGSFAGVFSKINVPLDEKKGNPISFIKTLSMQNIVFDVSEIDKGSFFDQSVSIQIYGLKTGNKKIILNHNGIVTNAEVADLNSDGYPELLIYTFSGNGGYGDVIGYSVNSEKSISKIYFLAIDDNPEVNKSYRGRDEFAIVGTNLVRRFPIYKGSDPNSNPTGGYRQIQYKLKGGKASLQFVVNKISNYKTKLPF